MAASLSWRSVLYAGGLSATAGFVDAVAYLRLGGYFVSFMSGNTTRASADLVHGMPRGTLLALGLVGFFTLGVVLSTLAVRRAATHRRALVLGFTTALLAAAALSTELGGEAVMPPLLALAMGVVNTAYTRGGEVSVGLTYMTGSLVKAGQHFAAALTGAPHSPWLKYATLWAMILFGAVVGAVAYRGVGLHSLWVATAAALVWCLSAVVQARRAVTD